MLGINLGTSVGYFDYQLNVATIEENADIFHGMHEDRSYVFTLEVTCCFFIIQPSMPFTYLLSFFMGAIPSLTAATRGDLLQNSQSQYLQ